MLIDTNVILDALVEGSPFADWSIDRLSRATGPRLINAVVYAELAGGYPSRESLDGVLATMEITLAEMPRSALYLAGRVHRDYRNRGGQRTRVLADFMIGAHAVTAGLPLLTRNGRDYRAAFPSLTVICPETDG